MLCTLSTLVVLLVVGMSNMISIAGVSHIAYQKIIETMYSRSFSKQTLKFRKAEMADIVDS